jgi:hypothetical protein
LAARTVAPSGVKSSRGAHAGLAHRSLRVQDRVIGAASDRGAPSQFQHFLSKRAHLIDRTQILESVEQQIASGSGFPCPLFHTFPFFYDDPQTSTPPRAPVVRGRRSPCPLSMGRLGAAACTMFWHLLQPNLGGTCLITLQCSGMNSTGRSMGSLKPGLAFHSFSTLILCSQ